MRSIGINEHEYVGRCSVDGQAQRFALATSIVLDDSRTVLDRNVTGAVAGMTIDDDHVIGIRLHCLDDLGDQPFFVLGRDDDRDTSVGHKLKGSSECRAVGVSEPPIRTATWPASAQPLQYIDRPPIGSRCMLSMR